MSEAVQATDTPAVAIVGGGWTGLSCALTLARAGYQPIVFESANEAGGRARRAHLQGTWRDNGQHLMLAGCQALNQLFTAIGVSLPRVPFAYSDGQRHFSLQGRRGQTGLLLALLTAQGFSIGERYRLLRALLALRFNHWQVSPTQTVTQWLAQQKQPSALIQHFWAPLALAILNTPIECAAMTTLTQVLRDTLGTGCEALDIYLPPADLSTSIVTPLVRAIEAAGGQIRCAQRVSRVQTSAVGGLTLTLADASTHHFSQVVLAIPPWAFAHLSLLDGAVTQDWPQQYGSQPIATVYLGFPTAMRLPTPLMQIPGPMPSDATVWATDRHHCGEAGVIAVSLSADGAWTALDNDALAEHCRQHLLKVLGVNLPCLWHKVVTIRRATHAATPTTGQQTPLSNIPNLTLAGDWTHARYPATLEAAVQSGFDAAQKILKQYTGSANQASCG